MYEVIVEKEYGDYVVTLTDTRDGTDAVTFEGRGETLPEALRELAREVELSWAKEAA